MTRINERRCDVCGKRIEYGRFVRLKRTLFSRFKIRLYEWGIINPIHGDSGWRRRRFDVHEDCLDDVVDEVRRRAVTTEETHD